MWKVRRVQAGDRTVLRLSGRLESEQLKQLEEALASEAAIYHLILDLSDIRLVDQDVVRFLADCEAAGATLHNCPPYIREWITAEKTANESILN
jgi:anti-anti-sigma regulatory factor